MQLFVTHPDPVLAARDLDDARVVKIILEVAQILCSVLYHQGTVAPYKPTHMQHPITLWAAADTNNAAWTRDYGLELCRMYECWRGRSHASKSVIEVVGSFFPENGYAPASFQNSARGHGLDFTHLPVLEAYRTYLNARWLTGKKAPRWTGRHHPEWFEFRSEAA